MLSPIVKNSDVDSYEIISKQETTSIPSKVKLTIVNVQNHINITHGTVPNRTQPCPNGAPVPASNKTQEPIHKEKRTPLDREEEEYISQVVNYICMVLIMLTAAYWIDFNFVISMALDGDFFGDDLIFD
ncbi:hypothetical protein GLAREA_10141 [Glarea lozoyensis ATCC 20868]|uniref:Uncharacterized protein n=1 Tax=Glarea lozoyensis (strain ATCC 20868 / MF5171) TaxID=1116229 RepID=S3D7H3_GLAL2|nr:uncharacterized protein GLAREA_10141 [Glarea lozoyensis ATCC 20868]EPE34447.1 hypothetical protein GLAREA_10141 [Glarea lozoyensis ATCC 20868]